MDRLIRIHFLDKQVHMAPAQKLIARASILSAFLLPADAIISLSYRMNDIKIVCEMSLTGDAFLLPTDGKNDYYLESSKIPLRPAPALTGSLHDHHDERSESPRICDERLTLELRNRLYFIPRAQKAFQDSEETSKESNEIHGGCVSPISPRAAVTYVHRTNKTLRVYDEEEDSEANVRGIVEICHCDNPSIRHSMKVIVIDSHHDFVILYASDGRDIFEDYPFESRSPRNFELFLGFGLSYKNRGGQQVTYGSGRIRSVMVDYRGRMLASASTDEGDSGGPCYSENRSLIGIMVSSTTTEPVLEEEYDRETMEDELRDASPADTWITPGSLIIEAFRKWQVKQGVIKVRPDQERGGSKPKRIAIDIS